MGLAERKFKQRIGHDPRNLTWSEDKSRFSYKHMTTLGWADNTGIGRDLTGNPNHIAVARKLDNGGIGMSRARKEGDDQAAGAGQAGKGLEDVLKRLSQAASPSPSPSPAPAEASTPESKLKNRNASRQRHLNAKRLAASSPAALAEILGVPVSSLPASPSPLDSTPSTPVESTDVGTSNERTADEPVTTSTISVSDYFRQKMREKMLARQASSSGSTTPQMPESSLANIKEEKVAVGGVAWEGSKMEFEEVKVEVTNLGGDEMVKVEAIEVKTEPTDAVQVKLEPLDLESDRSAKKQKKEEKRRTKDGKKDKTTVKVEKIDDAPQASSSVLLAEPSSVATSTAPSPLGEDGDDNARRARKEEKRRRKEEKLAKQDATIPSAETPASESAKKRKRNDDPDSVKVEGSQGLGKDNNMTSKADAVAVREKKEKKSKKDKKGKKDKVE